MIKSLLNDSKKTGTQVSNSTFIFNADKVLGFPVETTTNSAVEDRKIKTGCMIAFKR